MSNFRYRPEVDGLRAVAVLGVVLFHIGLGFPGGYVGVDVFFVISGFLITGIIMKDLKRGTFSMLDFLVRRIRRIMPAVSVMVIASLLAGYWLLSPRDFTILGKSAIAQSVMASNVYFFRHTDYFAGSGDFKPLLHTWSLAVEEQFYVVFPMLLFVLWKWCRKYLFFGVVAMATLSLALSCYGASRFQDATFYLLPARAWEMLAGSILAVWLGKNEKVLSSATNEFLSWGGILMIMGAMIFYTSETIFPGWSAILPVVGSALFILANKHQLTSAGKILSRRPMVFIGLISYSLYLWHWPVIVFARNAVIDINIYWKLILLVLSLVLAVISWRFVEAPFRKKGRLDTRLSAFSFGAVSTAALLLLSALIWKMDGVPNRIPEHLKVYTEDIDWNGTEYQSKNGELIWMGDLSNMNKASEGKIDFALWGDSHAMTAAATLDELAKKHHLRGLCYVRSATVPVLGFSSSLDSHNVQRRKLEFNDQVYESIEKKGIKNVILIGHWTGSFSGDKVADNFQKIKEMVLRMREKQITCWILTDVPEINDSHLANNVYAMKRFPQINRMDPISISRDQYDLENTIVHGQFDTLPRDLVNVVDVSGAFFNKNSRLKTFDQRAYYRDTNHLTKYGADYYLGATLEDIMIQILDRR
tara:strand:- start:266 stop:2197 length:1932 start_codon:yes stop_codon:yes gene_type:complete